MTTGTEIKIQRPVVWFLLGLLVGGILSAVLLRQVSFFQGGPPNLSSLRSTSDRVHQVVEDWSGSSDFTDADQLTEIWDRTRNTGHHDYPFEKGGSDNLAKILNNEFLRHPPKADVKATPEMFPPTGDLKTVAQLVTDYNVHVRH